MEKEILELVVLGLQRKERFSTENIVNALASLPTEQQHQWIKTMLSNGQPVSNNNPQTGSKQFDSHESESKINHPVDNDDFCGETCVLRITPQPNALKFKIIKYLHEELEYSLSDAKKLVSDNSTFDIAIPFCKYLQTTDDFTNLLKCAVKRM